MLHACERLWQPLHLRACGLLHRLLLLLLLLCRQLRGWGGRTSCLQARRLLLLLLLLLRVHASAVERRCIELGLLWKGEDSRGVAGSACSVVRVHAGLRHPALHLETLTRLRHLALMSSAVRPPSSARKATLTCNQGGKGAAGPALHQPEGCAARRSAERVAAALLGAAALTRSHLFTPKSLTPLIRAASSASDLQAQQGRSSQGKVGGRRRTHSTAAASSAASTLQVRRSVQRRPTKGRPASGRQSPRLLHLMR